MGALRWKSDGLRNTVPAPFLPNSGYAFVVIHPADPAFEVEPACSGGDPGPGRELRLSILNTYYRLPPAAAERGPRERVDWLPSAHREVPSQGQMERSGRVFEGGCVEVGKVSGRAVVPPAETNLDLPRGSLDDELLHRARIVSCRNRRAEAPYRPILVEPEPAVRRGHPNQ